MEKNKNNLVIYQKYMELIEYTNNILRKYPKSETFALVKECKSTLYTGLRLLIYAIKAFHKQDKLKYLNELDTNLHIRSIDDKELLAFTKLLIFDSRDESFGSVGIPIGNYTSQFFANIYLNELDQYVKRVLKVKYYVRYMDDFILLLKTKEECKKLKSIIEKFLNDNLKLSLNNKSRYYPYKMGVNFCGYRIFTTHKLLRINSKKKIKKHVKHWNHLYSTGRLNVYNTMQSLNSWLGHTRHCDSFKLQHKILNNCNFLVNDKSYEYVEKDLINLIENDTKKMS